MLMTSWQLTATGYLPICSWLLKRTRKLYEVAKTEEEEKKLQAVQRPTLNAKTAWLKLKIVLYTISTGCTIH